MRTTFAALALCSFVACLAQRARASGRGYYSSGFNPATGHAYHLTQVDGAGDAGEPTYYNLEAWDIVEKKLVWRVRTNIQYFVEGDSGSQVRGIGYDVEALQGPNRKRLLLLETHDAATGEKISSEPFAKGYVYEPPVALPSGEIFAVTFDPDDSSTGNLETGVQTFSQPSGKKFVSVLNSGEEGKNPDMEKVAASPVDNVVYFPYTIDRPSNKVSWYDATGDKEPVTAAVGEPLDNISIFGTTEQKEHMFVYGTRTDGDHSDLTISVSKVSKDLSTVSWTYTGKLGNGRDTYFVIPLGMLYVEGHVVFLTRVFNAPSGDVATLKDTNSGNTATLETERDLPIFLVFLDAETGEMKRAVSKNPSDAFGEKTNYELTSNPTFYSSDSETIALVGVFPNSPGQHVSDIDIGDDLDALGVPLC